MNIPASWDMCMHLSQNLIDVFFRIHRQAELLKLDSIHFGISRKFLTETDAAM